MNARAVDVLGQLLGGDVPADLAETAPGLAQTARTERVHALLVERWAGDTATPPLVRELLDTFTDELRAAAVVDALRMRELASVVAELAAAGVAPLVFKGSALGPTLYGASHLRPRVDSDVLVEPAHFEVARAVLEARGYDPGNQIPGDLANNAWAFVREDERGVLQIIDLHWRFNNGPTVAPALTPAALLARGVACEALPGALIPCDVDALLLAAVHAYTHHATMHRPLIWLVDLDLLARRLDDGHWHELLSLARDNEVSSVLARALADAQEMLGTPVPAFVEARLHIDATDDTARTYLGGHPGVVMLREFAGLPSWRARARMLRQLAFPAPDYVLRQYGVADDRMLPRLYAHRLLRAAGRYALPRRKPRRGRAKGE